MVQGTYLSAEVWGKIHAEAWLDPTFKARLEEDPTAAVRDFCGRHGISISGLKIMRVSEKPGDLTDEQLTDVIKGVTKLYVNTDNSC